MTRHAKRKPKPSRKVGRKAARLRHVRHLRAAAPALRQALQSPRRARPVEEARGEGAACVEARAEGQTATVSERNGLRVYASAAGTRYVIEGTRREIEIFVPSNSYSRVIEDIRGVKFRGSTGKV